MLKIRISPQVILSPTQAKVLCCAATDSFVRNAQGWEYALVLLERWGLVEPKTHKLTKAGQAAYRVVQEAQRPHYQG